MPKLTAFAQSEEKMSEGIPVHVGAGFYLRVRPFSCPEYQDELQKLLKPRRRFRGRDDDVTDPALMKRAAARTLITGWGASLNGSVDVDGNVITDAEDLADEDGNVIPFSTEKAEEFLTSPRYRPLWLAVVEVAGDETAFAEADIEDAAGNSQTSSAGGTTTEET